MRISVNMNSEQPEYDIRERGRSLTSLHWQWQTPSIFIPLKSLCEICSISASITHRSHWRCLSSLSRVNNLLLSASVRAGAGRDQVRGGRRGEIGWEGSWSWQSLFISISWQFDKMTTRVMTDLNATSLSLQWGVGRMDITLSSEVLGGWTSHSHPLSEN